MKKLLRVSSALIIVGLAVEIASLLWFHPLSFVFFAFFSAALVAAGVVVYLISLLFVGGAPSGSANQSGS